MSSASSGEPSGDPGSTRALLTRPTSDRQYRCTGAETGVLSWNRSSAADIPAVSSATRAAGSRIVVTSNP
ncbi:hypothetical protein [Geodermatophilus saharensis]|uniref:hypothetical protein n=1 Tax=Geodermatophilus saharensis TaxID=1137994 RepID=UPI001FE2DB35|nr:hypothetical protein [Geodermatophilus saharensis]